MLVELNKFFPIFFKVLANIHNVTLTFFYPFVTDFFAAEDERDETGRRGKDEPVTRRNGGKG